MQNPYSNLLANLWSYGASWRVQIVGYYAAYIIAQSFLSLSPYSFGRTIDALQNFSQDRLSEVIFWLGCSVGVTLAFWIFHGPARIVERSVALKIQQSFRQNIYEKISLLPLKWHQNNHTGNIITRLNRSSSALQRFAEHQFVYTETIIRFVVSMGFLLWISMPIGLVSLCMCALIIVPMVFFDKKLVKLYYGENEIDNKIGSVFYDYINNMTTVLTLRLEKLTHSNLCQRMLTIWPFFRKAIIINEVKWFIMMFTLSIVQATVLISYIIYSLKTTNTVQLGLVAMVFRYQSELNAVFHELSSQLGEIVRMDTDVKGIQVILDDIEKHASKPSKNTITTENWNSIEIENLVFHHGSGQERGQIFKGINLTIKRGEKIALIGLSGGGKSTLLNLLSGHYAATSANLAIDGIPFKNLDTLRNFTTLIPQDPEMFENTVAFNITLDLPASAKEIARVVNLASFSHVLDKLPEGLNTDIREKGLNLSVGQKQRLALARGLFAAEKSSLVLLDEPTSSVDLPTEKEILCNVIEAYPDTAMIVSLHRLHLLPHFDSVIMLNQGEVMAAGPIQDLLQQPGPVQELWNAYNGSVLVEAPI